MSKELLDFMIWVNQDKKLGYTSIGIERIVNRYITSKERFNQIIDETYGNYISYIHDIVQGEHQIYGNWYGKKEFIDKCKTDLEFSEKWGLKIEERELSSVERMEYYGKHFMKETESKTFDELLKVNYDELNIPTKQITLEYNGTKIEVYE